MRSTLRRGPRKPAGHLRDGAGGAPRCSSTPASSTRRSPPPRDSGGPRRPARWHREILAADRASTACSPRRGAQFSPAPRPRRWRPSGGRREGDSTNAGPRTACSSVARWRKGERGRCPRYELCWLVARARGGRIGLARRPCTSPFKPPGEEGAVLSTHASSRRASSDCCWNGAQARRTRTDEADRRARPRRASGFEPCSAESRGLPHLTFEEIAKSLLTRDHVPGPHSVSSPAWSNRQP